MLPRNLFLLNAALAGLALVGGLTAAAPKLPRPLADVSIDLPGAKRVRLIDTKKGAKLRILALMASTCDHCEEMTVSLSKIERQFRAKGLQVYGALVDEEAPQRLPKFVAKTKPSFQIGTLSQDNTRRVADFGINDHPYVPILMFVDPSNMIRLQLAGDDPLLVNSPDKNITNVVQGLLSSIK